MIPILYNGTETSFTSNGLGRLADAITCKVVEERNSTYELEMTYPVTGAHFDDIQEGRIILAKPFDGGLTQPFTIYQITKPLNQVVTVKAQHISYQLSGIVVMPFEVNSCISAIAGIKNYSATTNPFNFTTDKQVTAHYEVTAPTSARALLCGQQGSILDVFGKGDYEFNRFDVNLRTNRGSDNHVTLRYGKNITDLKNVVDITNVYTGIVPYWMDGEGNQVVLPEKVVLSGHENDYPYKIIKAVDFSSEWENQPTVEQLRTKAQTYVANNEGWKLKNNITVSFVALWNTEEYKDIAPLERVKMCDIVHVVVPKFGINFDTKVVKTDYNVLQEKYNSITLGDTYYTLSAVFSEEITRSEESQSNHMQKAIAHATKLITGGLGGHVVFNLNADGEPQEILIMDTDNIQTAVQVIRMNKNGIGFSLTGYNGPFHTAWTIDGHFVADYIDTGTLNADIIKAGRLQDEANNNYWDMVTGDFRLCAAALVNNDIATKTEMTAGDTNTFSSAVNTAVTTAEAYARDQADAAKRYAEQQADYALADAEAFARAQDAVTLTAAQVYANNGITTYDTYLNQLKVFNKLTNNGNLKGIYMQDGQLYINGTYIKTGTLDASLVNVTNINATNINTGLLQDASGNTKWNLTTGALSSKKFSIDSTYFQLSETGTITSIAQDGKKIVVDKGTITGYKSNGQLSAKLEIGDGYFNIANGQLAIQGVVGVSGSTSFVKSLTAQQYKLGSIAQRFIYRTAINCNVSGGSVGISGNITTQPAYADISGSIYINGSYQSFTGNVNIPSLYVNMNNSNLTYTNPTVTTSETFSGLATEFTPEYGQDWDVMAIKTVEANTGSINSQYGIIQSIS